MLSPKIHFTVRGTGRYKANAGEISTGTPADKGGNSAVMVLLHSAEMSRLMFTSPFVSAFVSYSLLTELKIM